MNIRIFGSGCAKCAQLAENAEAAARSLGLDYTMEKVTDVGAIADAGVMMTPALMVDDDLKVSGKVASAEAIADLLR